MIVVVDASAAIKATNPNAHTAIQLLTESTEIIAPTLYYYEILNVFWKFHKHLNYSKELCQSNIDFCLSLPTHYVSLNRFGKNIFEIAIQTSLTCYDSAYLFLAQNEKATLITLDKKKALTAKNLNIKVKLLKAE
jgi:predicted nucleic acid-binding protein